MKNNLGIWFVCGLLGAAVCVLYVLHFSKADKLAYIDTGVLLEKSIAMQNIKMKFKKEASIAQAQIDTVSLQFENSMKEYERNQAKMNTKERQLSQELLRTKQSQLIQYRQSVEQKILQEEQRQTKEVLDNINSIIADYGKKNNYKLIFGTSNGSIVYGEKGIEITDEVLKLLNNE